MIYFLVTTCLYENNFDIRKSQYMTGIPQLKKVIHDMNIENYKIIIIENNGNRETFLSIFDCEIFYTQNNFLPTRNIGIKEWQDVMDCIDKYNINDTDFIVKITGRYILDDDSEFMRVIKTIHETQYDCVIKYGPFYGPVNYKMKDCITGLIGMSCYYVKQIEKPRGNESVEWNWAKATYLMEDDKICMVNKLGISICPGSNNYFKV